jgi:hypothetical protein
VIGVLAQLVERLNGIEEVRGSNPLGSTTLLGSNFPEAFGNAPEGGFGDEVLGSTSSDKSPHWRFGERGRRAWRSMVRSRRLAAGAGSRAGLDSDAASAAETFASGGERRRSELGRARRKSRLSGCQRLYKQGVGPPEWRVLWHRMESRVKKVPR